MPLNYILLSQIAGYVIAFLCSLCIAIPMTLHQDEFRGHCLLFSTGVWLERDGQFMVKWSSQAYCNYTIFVGVVLAIVSLIQIYRMARYMYQGTDSNFLSAFFDVIGCFFLCGMSVVAALMITFGFIVWCNDMTMRFSSCELASGADIDRQDGIDTTNFYFELGAAQFGAWASMACWVGLSVFALLKMCQQHQIMNMRASMFRERQRLINEGNKIDADVRVNHSNDANECKGDKLESNDLYF
ncbi:transmembrane protein 179 [Cimex lectularius]|uniref:Transmembrane protein 179 n=1 Tax=Cimex lectularius TaxID=79782 RepID=A0A8I6RGW8_CIMLE|nr:transmembrane protein 179 [Cimex lectularius]